MRPVEYFKNLSEEEKLSYAKRAGCSIHHLKLNLFHQSAGPKKRPNDELIIDLAKESKGGFTLDEAIEYFLVEPCKKKASHKNETDLPANSPSVEPSSVAASF